MVALFLLGVASVMFAADAVARWKRVVCLGDSITDGHTYPLLVQQALREAGQPVPVMIGAGIGADTGKGMLVRLARDVFVHEPDLVMLMTGVNDQAMSMAEYENMLRDMIIRLQKQKIDVMLLTLTVIDPLANPANKKLDAFDEVIRRLGREMDCAVAEVSEPMKAAMAAGRKLHEADHVHLNLDGYRTVARAVLDALGYRDVPLPSTFKPPLLPGVIREWRMRPADDQAALEEKTVASLKPDETWKTVALPLSTPVENWWKDQERQRGVAVGLNTVLGAGKRFQGIAVLRCDREHPVYFNTGADLQSVWLNDKLLWQRKEWTGWHPGKERLPAVLRAGENVIVIESGADFFLSVPDDKWW
jgi:lysophospholipase L1-like esterase